MACVPDRGRRLLVAAVLLALVGCGGSGDAGGGGSAGEAAEERQACQQVRGARPALVEQFVADWGPRLLDEAFQRTFISNTPLPPELDPTRYGDLSAKEQLGLASCLAQRLAEQRTGPPPVTVEDCEPPRCRDVYADSYVTTTGTPLSGSILSVLIFERESARLPGPGELPPTVEPIEPLEVPALPTVPPPPAPLDQPGG